MTTRARTTRKATGFSLVELMVALALGLLLTIAMGAVYLSSKGAFTRLQQLGALQQSARTAFEYLSGDARMVGHMGCYTGLPTTATPEFNSSLAATGVGTNYAIGVEGYEYRNTTAGAYTLGSSAPADVTAASDWEINSFSTNGITTIPIAAISGAGNGLTPGSDVLVIRTVSGRPVRLAANANGVPNQNTFTIETMAASTGKCSNGTTDKVSGFCADSHGLIAGCARARVFQVSAIAAGASPAPSTLTLSANMGVDPVYTTDKTEVFPMQTIAYYVKRSSSGTTTSLYRRIFDGDYANGLEQELIEGVENLQVRYGIDTTAPDPDGVVDKYVEAKAAAAADSVTDWNKVVAVRVGLLMRSAVPVEGDVSVAATGSVNGVTVTYPAGTRYDRRVFTSTMAVRNKISYF